MQNQRDPGLASPRHRALALASAVLLGLLASGCSGKLAQFKASIAEPSTPEQGAGALQDLARRYDSKPGDKRMSLPYAAALRAAGQHAQAVAVLQRASIQNVGDREISAAYGKALADVGKFQEAMQVLSQAHGADRPDWRILSTQGAISDQMGEHARAREFYQQALQIAPDEPVVLTNLGLSHVLTKDLAGAERHLRRAASMPGADARVQANLALVLSLRARQIPVASLDGPKTGARRPAKAQ